MDSQVVTVGSLRWLANEREETARQPPTVLLFLAHSQPLMIQTVVGLGLKEEDSVWILLSLSQAPRFH